MGEKSPPPPSPSICTARELYGGNDLKIASVTQKIRKTFRSFTGFNFIGVPGFNKYVVQRGWRLMVVCPGTMPQGEQQIFLDAVYQQQIFPVCL